MIIIYKLKNIVNSKIYVGQTCQTLQDRCRNGNGYAGCTYIHNAINFYGINNFYYEIITFCGTQEVANYLEQLFIDKYDSRNPEKGYNIALGGTNGTFTGRKHTEKSIEKMKQAHKGLNTWMVGRTNHHSEEHKKELSKKMKENKVWEKAPSNLHHLLKWIDEKHTKIQKEQYPSIIEEYKKGIQAKELAGIYNVHITVIQKIVKGTSSPHRANALPKGFYDIILEDHKNKIKVNEIAKKLGIASSTVRRVIKRTNGLQ